ncbi:MAG: GGDEF domain-containing response regulator [Spirochaetales bacterium]|nr:GGDEF domain-containing response regulator [Spirochaetales bacterium]
MQKVNILLVEYKQEDRELLSKHLSQNGHELFLSESTDNALNVLDENDIQIILVNINIEPKQVDKLCQEIRKRFYNKPIQLLFISDSKNKKVLQQLMDWGGDDFIKKPINGLEIKARIKAAIIRLRKQISIYEERNFLKNAVFQEEQLSSKILDQNLYLKKAFKNITKQNKELKRKKKELEKIAMYDTLSGLLNRMSLFNRIDIEIERTIRALIPLTGIMLDIDHFKEINDNFGHQCGDMVIREIGTRLRNQLRKYDYAGRYGGEEFFIILPNTNLMQAYTIGERFRKEIESSTLGCGDDEVKITVSLGIAQYRSSEAREKWIDRTDKAMYLAKQQGRNRVCTE